MTANASDTDKQKCLEAGMCARLRFVFHNRFPHVSRAVHRRDEYISKPVNQQVLEDKLNKWIAKRAFATSSALYASGAPSPDSPVVASASAAPAS